jgi:hypothetical protein
LRSLQLGSQLVGQLVAQKQIDTTIRLAITQAAFEAIASTLPPGSVTYEPGADANGMRYVWLPPFAVERLRFLRGPGESYSDVILRLAASEGRV